MSDGSNAPGWATFIETDPSLEIVVPFLTKITEFEVLYYSVLSSEDKLTAE